MNNANRLRTLNNALLISGQDYSDTLLDSALELDKLRGLLHEGIALMSSRNREEWRKRASEALGGSDE